MRKLLLTIVSLSILNLAYAENYNSMDESTGQNSIVSIDNSKSDNSGEEEKEGGYSEVATKKYRNYFGICSGLTYNYGISYRRWFKEDNFALQLHIFPLIYRYYDDYDEEYYTRGMLKGGITFLKRIKSYNYVRLLYYVNGTVSYDIDNEYTYENDYDYVGTYEQTEELSVGAATGPGFEFYVWRFSFDVFLGVSGKYNIDTEEYHVLPAAETAIHFRF